MRIVIVLAAISITLAATAPVSAQTDPYDNAKQCQKDYDSDVARALAVLLACGGLDTPPGGYFDASGPNDFNSVMTRRGIKQLIIDDATRGLEACLAKARKDAAMSSGKRDKTLFQPGKVRQQKPHANPRGAAAVESCKPGTSCRPSATSMTNSGAMDRLHGLSPSALPSGGPDHGGSSSRPAATAAPIAPAAPNAASPLSNRIR